MKLDLRYLGKSAVDRAPAGGLALRLEPNLARPKVFFDAEIADPLRFREAISALHDVVVGDLRRPRPDRAAWLAWKAEEARKEAELRARAHEAAKGAELERLHSKAPPPDLEPSFRRAHGQYWTARRQWADELARTDPALFRHLVPCDPVVTVADDVVFFECFSKDESSYGCLSVDRDGFRDGRDAARGTTNVDYSLALYDHFQTLRSYRPTRLVVDPAGFEVQVAGGAELREEKIDLPPSWLRGFGQLSAALSLPARAVELSVDAVYSILAWLARHRERKGPRSLRFKLTPGRPPLVVVEPWGVEIASHGAPDGGDAPAEIQIWGRRRLRALARVLPLAERVSVRLLGTGLPSIWTAHLGGMRFVLALSGWTANDWTGGGTLEQLGPGARVDAGVVEILRLHLARAGHDTVAELARRSGATRGAVAAALHRLAEEGQVIHDAAADVVRWRQVLPVALSADVLGPPPPEAAAAPALVPAVRVERREAVGARVLVVASVGGTACEAILEDDGRFARARCTCKHFHRSRLRAGPCRHLIALRIASRIND